jgi:hypothetical protein
MGFGRAGTVAIMAASFWVTASPAAVASPDNKPGRDDLDVIADVFFPEAQVEILLRDACHTAYETKLAGNTVLTDAEKALPGLRQRMVDAATGYCAANTPGILQGAHQHIKQDWLGMARPQQLALLASTFRKVTEEAPKIALHEGDTAVEGVHRQQADLDQYEQAINRAAATLTKVPGGPQLLEKVAAYQKKADADRPALMTPAYDVIREALHQAHLAANAYAREKGFDPLYRD